MRNKPIQADQLIPTSATPPPEAGFYRIDRHTIGVVGNMSFRDPNTQVMTSAVTANTDPLTGGITLSGAGEQDLLAAMGVASTASVVTYNAAGQVETCTLGEKTWTVAYDSAGKATSETDGTVIRTFNYDASGRYTGYSEA